MGNVNLYLRFPKMKTTSPVVILGCTGTGKSKLAIELAKRFNGEIISADSMQVYKGLDIVTNKVTPAEQLEAVHHFISCTDPLKRYTVVDFSNKAVPLIDSLMKQNKLPIIVGGTNYYIESLLWDVLIKSSDTLKDKLLFETDSHKKIDLSSFEDDKLQAEELLKYSITQHSVECLSDEVLHKILKIIDPEMANSLHPKDRRKVIRSLQVFQQHGLKHSDLLSQQRSKVGGSSLGGPLRYRNSFMLWLQCEKNVLEKRLDDRLQQMLDEGLIDELLNFHKVYNASRVKSDLTPCYTTGIFQSIGFKEFHDFLIMSDEEKKTPAGEKLRQNGIELMSIATKQYSRKQIKWIRNRFLRNSRRQVPPIYGLDATDVNLWQEKVLDQAIHIVQATLKNEPSEIAPLAVEERPEDDKISYYCDICEQIIVGTEVWKVHLNSKRHSKRKEGARKKIKTEECDIKHSVQDVN